MRGCTGFGVVVVYALLGELLPSTSANTTGTSW